MRTLTFAPGDVIFWQGDFSASMFDIISGKVGIYIGYETDQEKLLAELGKEDTLGEMGMIEAYPRSATAVALEPETVLVEIGEDELNDYFKNNVKPSSSELNPNHKEYWIKLGEKVELGEKFANCVENDETLDEIITNTRKTANLASGMPFFKFNRFTSSGFDTKNSYEDVLMFFQAGLES